MFFFIYISTTTSVELIEGLSSFKMTKIIMCYEPFAFFHMRNMQQKARKIIYESMFCCYHCNSKFFVCNIRVLLVEYPFKMWKENTTIHIYNYGFSVNPFILHIGALEGHRNHNFTGFAVCDIWWSMAIVIGQKYFLSVNGSTVKINCNTSIFWSYYN